MRAYKHNVVIFGGGGEFFNDILMREAFNDLWLWDTIENKSWKKV